ncbi:MAG: hypothetical protein CL823_03115 [Crocinitomicaceae bacterium]|nr:hypothetical protein [Crocinitomicaceae bacterium]|tara:strand:+ start:136 stop:1080 length:945 start_codon:yes stop_codon:yes gene_type:complete
MRTVINTILTSLIIVTSQANVGAQQDYLASQYNFNSLMLNPAYAGAHSYIQTSTMYRSQWRIEGAPTTQILCIDGKLDKLPIGIGLMYSSDRIGVVRERVLGADMSYHFRTSWGKISFGLRGGFVGYSAKLDDLVVWDENDPLYVNGNLRERFLTLGFGTFVTSNSGKWFGGISVPGYFARDHVLRASPDTRFYKRHMYLYGGGVVDVSSTVALKPSVLIRYMETNPILVDFNLHALIYDKAISETQVWLGAGLRTNMNFLMSVEADLPYNLRVGYSFDVIGKGLYTHMGAAHEIQIGFDFGGSTTIIQSPRYF